MSDLTDLQDLLNLCQSWDRQARGKGRAEAGLPSPFFYQQSRCINRLI